MIEEPRTPLTDVELREQAEHYRSIFEATTDGLVISDMDGYVVEANPAFCRMSGYTRDGLIGLHGTALTHRDSLHTVEQTLRRVREGDTLHYEGLGLRKDGSVCPAEVHVGTFTYKEQPHMLAVVRDITDRVQAEEQLREREEQYRSIFEATSDGLIINDLETGLVVEVNPAFCAMNGYTRDELIGLHPTAFIHPDSHYLFAAYMQAVQEGRSFQAPAVNVRKDGSLLPIEVHGSLFTYQRKPHILGVVRDITQRVEAEQAVLEERQRLSRELHDSVSQALYGIGLAAETTRVLLQRDPGRATKSNEMIRSLAQSAVAEMRALLFELRPESLELEGLVTALQKQAAALEARYEIPVEAVLCHEPSTSLPVKEALYRITQEAAHNAIKHAGPTRIKVRLDCDEGETLLEVRDDGKGFDTRAPFPGHLGLHSMRERAAGLGGTFELESAPGEGTCVRVRIPSADRP